MIHKDDYKKHSQYHGRKDVEEEEDRTNEEGERIYLSQIELETTSVPIIDFNHGY